jgi:hypothetical protein
MASYKDLSNEIVLFLKNTKLVSISTKLKYSEFENDYCQLIHKGLILNLMANWEYLIREIISIEHCKYINLMPLNHPFNNIQIYEYLKIDRGTIPYNALKRVDELFNSNFSVKIKQVDLDHLYFLRNRLSHGESFLLAKEEYDSSFEKIESMFLKLI